MGPDASVRRLSVARPLGLALILAALAPGAPALERPPVQTNLLPRPLASARAQPPLAAAPAWRPGAPELIRYAWGGSPRDGFGHALAAMDDLDGDDVPDLIVGASQRDAPGHDGQGYVVVLGGATGGLLLEVIGAVPGARFGEAVCAAGDVNGDGTPDLAVGAPGDGSEVPGGGALRLVSGRDGTQLQAVLGATPGEALGSAVACLGDVNGDGRDDVLVGGPGTPGDPDGFGRLLLVSGGNGAVLWRVVDDTPGAAFGSALVALDDLDGDDVPDLAVSAPWDAERGGRVDILSGADGSRLQRLEGDGPGRFGAALAAMGDRDDDGLGELVIGTPDTSPWSSGVGSVSVVSPKRGRTLFSARGGDPRDGFGSAVCAAGDVDGDGVGDLFVGAPAAGYQGWRSGRVSVVSGADGSVVHAFDGRAAGEGFGRAVACLGDLDDDGRADLVTGLSGRTRLPPPLGTVRTVSGRPPAPVADEAPAKRRK